MTLKKLNKKLKNIKRARNSEWAGGVCLGFARATNTPVWAYGFAPYLILWWILPEED